MNRKDLQALSLVGSTWKNPVLDPLAVLHLNNRLFINRNSLSAQNTCLQTTVEEKVEL